MVATLIAAAIPLAAEFLPGMVRYFAGDKAGDVAKTVVETAQAITGTTTPEAAAAAMRADPALAAKFRVDMAQVEIEHERIAAQDRDSARRMQMETRSPVPGLLALAVSLTFAGSSVAVLTGMVEGLKDPLTAALIGTVIGNITAAMMQVLNFYLGTNASSKHKDQAIANLSK